MVTIKNGVRLCLLAASMTVLWSGCAPPGPRALLEGKRLLDQGRFAQAAESLQRATAILSTNAQAWNYLGLAYHGAGKLPEAERAYQKALQLDHDLTEARYNLGCAYLALNNLDAAKSQLTTYTLRQPNSIDGLLKLGSAQVRTRDFNGAERSYGQVLRLNNEVAEAWSGIGLVRSQRGLGAEALQYFARALKSDPKYGPAMLNAAIVSQQMLNDPARALYYYKQYLALTPPPRDAESVRAIVRQLEHASAATGPPPATNAPALLPGTNVARAPDTAKPEPAKPVVTNAPRTIAATAPQPTPSPPQDKPGKKNTPPSPAPAPEAPYESVRLAAEPTIKSATDTPQRPPSTPAQAEPKTVVTAASPEPAPTVAPRTEKKGFLRKINPLNLLSKDKKAEAKSTPLPATRKAGASLPSAQEPASPPAQRPIDPSIPRYRYQHPARPAAGNRAEAEKVFREASTQQSAGRFQQAIESYRKALRLDPAFFEAAYNLGLASADFGDAKSGLAAYETALAIKPDSSQARYSFALLLKASGYLADATEELEKVLKIAPNDAKAHLALGNLYAQQLRQPANARAHYQRVLELDPRNPQAPAIRYWLTQNLD